MLIPIPKSISPIVHFGDIASAHTPHTHTHTHTEQFRTYHIIITCAHNTPRRGAHSSSQI